MVVVGTEDSLRKKRNKKINKIHALQILIIQLCLSLWQKKTQ